MFCTVFGCMMHCIHIFQGLEAIPELIHFALVLVWFVLFAVVRCGSARSALLVACCSIYVRRIGQ